MKKAVIIIFLLFVACNKEKNDIDSIIDSAFNDEIFKSSMYRYKGIYINKEEIIFLKNDKISKTDLDGIKFLNKTIIIKDSNELLETLNADFFYFLDLKVSENMAKIILVYGYSPLITIYMEKIENEWSVTDCITKRNVFLKKNEERKILDQINLKKEPQISGDQLPLE